MSAEATRAQRLTVTAEGLGVAAQPGGMLGGVGLSMKDSLANTTGLASSGGEATGLAVLVDGGDDPVDASVVTDGIVLGINQDDLEVLVGRILSNPVAVENTEVSASTANLALSLDTEGTLVLQLVDTLGGGLSVDNVGHGLSLTSSTTNLHSVDDKTLLGLETKTTGLLGTSGAGHTADGGQLAVLPGADAQKETHSIRLLLLPQLFKVFISSHFDGRVLVSAKESIASKKKVAIIHHINSNHHFTTMIASLTSKHMSGFIQ
jgi:hypothetical protein